MLPLVAQLQMQYADARDLVCVGVASSEHAAYVMAAASLPAIVFAWWYRPRAAVDDLHGTWAAVALLLGILQVIVCFWLSPTGCVSGHAASIFAGCASPWLVVAGLFRAAVAPRPEALRPDLPRGSADGRPGDPFA